MAWRYKLGLDVWEAILYGPIGSLNSKKIATRQLIWANEKQMWKATCILYGNVSNYQNMIKDIKMLAWWKFVRKKPIKMKQVSCLVAILSGTQPKGMQANFSNLCRMCDERRYESPEHVLMRCPRLSAQRLIFIHRIKAHMPPAMADCYEGMTISEKIQFFLSGFNSSFIEEWSPLYSSVAEFVWGMYKCRYELYNEVEQLPAVDQ